MAKELPLKSLIFTSILSMVFGVVNESAIGKAATPVIATQNQQKTQLLEKYCFNFTPGYGENVEDRNTGKKYHKFKHNTEFTLN